VSEETGTRTPKGVSENLSYVFILDFPDSNNNSISNTISMLAGGGIILLFKTEGNYKDYRHLHNTVCSLGEVKKSKPEK
jgi:hypothetical protein